MLAFQNEEISKVPSVPSLRCIYWEKESDFINMIVDMFLSPHETYKEVHSSQEILPLGEPVVSSSLEYVM